MTRNQKGLSRFGAAAMAVVMTAVVASSAAVAQRAAQRPPRDAGEPSQSLLEIGASSLRAVEANGASIAAQSRQGQQWLRIQPSGEGEAEVIIPAPDGRWDLSSYDSVVMQVRNSGRLPVTVRARAENDGAKWLQDATRGAVVLVPGQEQELRVRLTRRPEDPGYEQFQPFYMYFKNINVRDNTVDPAEIVRLVVSIDHPRQGQGIEVSNIRAVGQGVPAPVEFFPFIDEFGQYIHSDWPGKVYSEEDFAERIAEEEQEMADWPGPADWNQFGGWASGPELEATGFFYAAKHDGKWWLVDPEGRLFFSYGPTGVGYGGDVTPVSDREHWFRSLPERDDPQWGEFYRERRGATYQYYQHREWVGFDIGGANVVRKYGENYKEVIPELSHRRMRSWGFNTIANWSSSDVYLLRRTPYTVAIHYGGPKMHYRLPDAFHPEWEKTIRQRMEQERETTANDPWNIGYFVDNELWWGWRPRAAAVGEVAIGRGSDIASKGKFVEMLREKYETIEAFNEAWGTEQESWDALLAAELKPDMGNERVLADCGDFGMAFAEHYFSTVQDAVKAVAPKNMYLGVRFHGHIDPQLVALCWEYADVISYNIYDNPPDGRANQYRHLDVPIISGEWGIGSDPQQTPFRGDQLTHDPAERARAVARYADHALRHPLIVGAHFFQYRDQPLSGRPDGEAVLRGFVNITDTPSFELIQGNRRVAYEMYQRRYGGN
jgi:hypothetical protein